MRRRKKTVTCYAIRTSSGLQVTTARRTADGAANCYVLRHAPRDRILRAADLRSIWRRLVSVTNPRVVRIQIRQIGGRVRFSL